MPWFFLILMGVYGLLSCIFAFVEPPAAISRIFKVPSIFIFLPDHLVMKAGRIFVGLLCIGFAVFLFVKLSSAGVPM